jgi:hypothetical protein
MKKILLLSLLLMSSCFEIEPKQVYYIVVKLNKTNKGKEYPKGISKYFYSTDFERSSGLLYERSFKDSSNKYFVGDTVIR